MCFVFPPFILFRVRLLCSTTLIRDFRNWSPCYSHFIRFIFFFSVFFFFFTVTLSIHMHVSLSEANWRIKQLVNPNDYFETCTSHSCRRQQKWRTKQKKKKEHIIRITHHQIISHWYFYCRTFIGEMNISMLSLSLSLSRFIYLVIPFLFNSSKMICMTHVINGYIFIDTQNFKRFFFFRLFFFSGFGKIFMPLLIKNISNFHFKVIFYGHRMV